MQRMLAGYSHRAVFYWVTAKRLAWRWFVVAPFAVGGAFTFVRDEFLPPSRAQSLKVLQILPDIGWYWWALAALALLLIFMMEGAFREYRDALRKGAQPNKHPDMDLHELCLHISQVGYNQSTALDRWFYDDMAMEIRDRFSTGQLATWGRKVRRDQSYSALAKIDAPYWVDVRLVIDFAGTYPLVETETDSGKEVPEIRRYTSCKI